MYCKIQKCRFPDGHVSVAHKCGRCKQSGHGEVECKSSAFKRMLDDNMSFLPNHLPKNLSCQVTDCSTYWQHTTQSHHCSLCGDRHEEAKCGSVIKKIDGTVICPICKSNNSVNIVSNRIFGISETCKVCLDNEVEILLPGQI